MAFRIEIRLTSYCNLDCFYCDSLHTNKKEFIPFDHNGLRTLIDNLPEFIKKDLEIFIYGGEPTTHPEFTELVENLVTIRDEMNLIFDIIVQTNLSNPNLLKDYPIIVNPSWHQEYFSLSEFLKKINIIEKSDICRLGEIAYMDEGDNYSEYLLLKKLFKNVEFNPIISDLPFKSSNERLINLKNKPIFNMVQEDYHFIKRSSGLSNYDYWEKDLNNLEGAECKIQFNVIHLFENKVYFCFNGIFDSSISGIPFSEFQYSPEIIKCPFQRCYFDMKYTED